MKISKWVDMGQDVDVEIGVDDIRDALTEAFAQITEDESWAGGSIPNSDDIVRVLADIGSFLRALTDDQIALLNPAQRTLVETFLREHACRFQLGGLFKQTVAPSVPEATK